MTVPRPGFALWREYAGYFEPHASALSVIALGGLVQSFVYVPLAMLLQWIFDQVLVSRPGQLEIAIAALVGLQLASLALSYWIRVRALRLNHDVLAELRSKSLSRLYLLPKSFYVAADLERLHVTLVYDTNWIERMNNALTAQFLPASLSAAVLFAILFWIDSKYALIIAIAAPVLFVANRLVTRQAWFRQEVLRRAFESFSRGARFALHAMDLTREQAAEPSEVQRQSANVTELRRIALDLNRIDAAHELAQGAILLTAVMLVLIAGGYALARGTVTRGQVMEFYFAAALFATQTRAMVGAIPDIRMGMRAFRELDSILTNPEREPYQGSQPVTSIGTVRLDHVSFSYSTGPAILDNIDLAIEPGVCVALIGANGSGKSSLIHLIMGTYRPQTGILYAGATAYDDIDIRGLRSQMAIVPQNPLLFAGTIRENLIYGARDASESGLEIALRSAGAWDFVAELTDRLETRIGENGVRLSGGQCQRLVIARALLRRPELLILDEPTNHLDETAIELLMASLRSLTFRPAVLIISHEWRVLRHVDRAFRLAEGKLHPVVMPAGA